MVITKYYPNSFRFTAKQEFHSRYLRIRRPRSTVLNVHSLNFVLRKNLKHFRRLSLVILLMVGFTLRVWNINWDQGTHQHPDERYWSMVTEDISWPGTETTLTQPIQASTHIIIATLGSMALSSLHNKGNCKLSRERRLYSQCIVNTADRFGIGLKETSATSTSQKISAKAFDSGYKANLIGRLLSAIIDTGTIFLVYLLGRELFNRKSEFISGSPAIIRRSTYSIQPFLWAEPWVTFFASQRCFFR